MKAAGKQIEILFISDSFSLTMRLKINSNSIGSNCENDGDISGGGKEFSFDGDDFLLGDDQIEAYLQQIGGEFFIKSYINCNEIKDENFDQVA